MLIFRISPYIIMIFKPVLVKKFTEDEIIAFVGKNEQTQIMPLSLFKGEKHIISSINQTLKAFADGENISRNQSIEFLLRFLGERQISKISGRMNYSNELLFVSWADNADRIYLDFVKKFGAVDTKLPKVDKETELNAIQKSATFFIV